jgi:hypothetical protein
MSAISLLQEDANWRSRKVQYSAGDWDAIQTVLPEFDLVPFNAGQDEPANPFLRTVMRRPLTAAERPIPVAVVSRNYSLAPHRHVAALCREGLIKAGIEPADLRYEVGLSELGEWMNFRIYFADSYSFTDVHGNKLGLRLECFNSVDGSSRLVILFGWLRFVCANGLVIGETKIEIKERHRQNLKLPSIPKRIQPAKWQSEVVVMDDIKAWTDKKLSEQWGKKAAARVFHICDSGMDVEIDPFASGTATAKSVRYLDRVPGSRQRAETKYDVLQALSYVATHRNNTEERLNRQADIHRLLERLRTSREIKGGLFADRAV